MSARPIVTKPGVFTDAYVPDLLEGRGRQIKTLKRIFLPLSDRRPTRNVWLHGPPGSGKTNAAKIVLNEFKDNRNVAGLHINCWESNTFFTILDRIVAELRILGADRLSTVYKLARVDQFLHGRPLLLVLDEIDTPSPRERDAILYNLCGLPHVGLICVSDSRYFYFTLDRRVRSRLDAFLLEFARYSEDEVIHILKERAAEGLREGAYDEQLLRNIARVSQGDARVAVQTLKHAADDADLASVETIRADDVGRGLASAREGRRRYRMAALSAHHHLIYGIIQDAGSIRSGDLWREFLTRCARLRMEPVAPRTFSLYVKRLEKLDLIVGTRALGVRGNVRIVSVKSG